MSNTIWTKGALSSDTWSFFGETENRDGDVIITLADWQSGEWADHEGRLGIDLHAGDDIESVVGDLERFDLVVVNFPSFADGRAFSIARLIADKYAFEGDIRARGAYILDQMPMLERCGVTSFDISSNAVHAGLERGLWTDIPHYYQHAWDGKDNMARTRAADVKRPWTSVNISDQGFEQRDAA